jgi:putative transposase
VRRTVPPSAEIEAQIERLLSVGVAENPRESLSELAKLGARLIIQRAVEDEFEAWLGRARYERRPDHQRGLRNYGSGLRNGFRPRTLQTAEGELEVEIPQVREAAETFVSKLFPRGTKLVRTEPLKALVIGAFVRGLSMRDVESLCQQAGLESCRSRPPRASARSSGSAMSSSSAATSTASGWWRCSSTRPTWRCAPTGPRRASWSPGASPRPASACCWR